jgi:hypothetical protein
MMRCTKAEVVFITTSAFVRLKQIVTSDKYSAILLVTHTTGLGAATGTYSTDSPLSCYCVSRAMSTIVSIHVSSGC